MDHVAVGGLVFLIDFPISLVMNRVVNIPAALRYDNKKIITQQLKVNHRKLIALKYMSYLFENQSHIEQT